MPGFFSWIAGFFTKATPAVTPQGQLHDSEETIQAPPPSENTRSLRVLLEENLFCWLLDAAPSKLYATTSPANPMLEELDSRLKNNKMRELPRQPMTLPMLIQALSDESGDRKKLSRIILEDPALTDQLLHVANSPYFRTGEHTIESVDQAVFVLGMDGIRKVIAAALVRPMIAPRNSREALFSKRTWRWGLTCARATEFIAMLDGADASAHFTVGLLPALSYITLHRELHKIWKEQHADSEPDTALIYEALTRYQWSTSRLIAHEWGLPTRYRAFLRQAERPEPGQHLTALTDGILLGSREVLRHANQRNLPEEDLQKALHLTPDQLRQARTILKAALSESAGA
ncbi:HDOD domain-containing protein [Marinobacter adhaerens]|uniref:HDOD domain-containing protein n=1 Tax=Marinobacter adhaerens TaxID=1033846 RepID=A0A851HYN6_9GAMM|nr:HDOD domain-containing protein [Marinobacter adhaerens]NWN91061.1 HDOD domain-containing protein [Marinobacter adhaerens]